MSALHEQDSVDASIILWVVSDLCILSPDNLTTGGDKAELRDVHLNHCSLGDDTELGEKGRAGVLLNPDNGQLEGGLQLRVCHVGLLDTQTGGPDETFELWRLAGETVANEGALGDHTLPGLLALLAGGDGLEDFILGNASDGRKRNVPLASLLLSLLLDHVAQHLAAVLLITVHQIGRERSVSLLPSLLLNFLFIMLTDGLLHLDLLAHPLLV